MLNAKQKTTCNFVLIMKVTILGAGIAGLTTAVALKRAGINYTIYEASSKIGPVGAGLGLGANAIKAFRELGLAEEVIKAGRILSAFSIYSESGKIISKTDSVKISKRHGVDNFTIHRFNLHDILMKHAGIENILCNKRCVDFRENNGTISLIFSDNTEVETDFVIVSDGINSPIRQKLIPGSVPRYAGYTCWRGVLENSDFNITEASEIWGSKGRFGIVPLADNKVYWFACVNSQKNDSVKRLYTTSMLKKHFKDYPSVVTAVLEKTDNTKLIWADICDLKPLKKFAFGNILLIGDAAHATTPNMGQGACQAIEDGVVLGNIVLKEKNLAEAFKQFESKRIKRTTYVVNKSWQIGKAAQWENKLAIGFRNFLIKSLPPSFSEKQLDFLYKVDFNSTDLFF